MMSESMVHEIDLREDSVYIVKAGHITKLQPMAHGTDKIEWHLSSVRDVVRSHRVRLGNDKIISENP